MLYTFYDHTLKIVVLIGDFPNDIFNADESGLFFKLLPEKSLVLKGDSCHGGKRSKDRLTILSCAIMNRTEKIRLQLFEHNSAIIGDRRLKF